ncbi:MAG: alkene reductase [Verrucomicrobia bacterium]|nr:alkene reductase [Verrucomicrobiota bacterium]
MPSLFDPITLGSLALPNRIVMAPLTRCRAGAGRVPHALNARYYAQRASAGLIISEATAVDPMGVGYPDTPGIWNEEQAAGWRVVTDAVHAAGGRIVLQLWHVGRISDPHYLGGALPVAPSAIAPAGKVSLLRPARPFVTPRALATEELAGVAASYRRGAQLAREAGFDGVELHGANGYLLDQFLQSSTNQRTDAYGGSIAGRARFPLEVTDAVLSVWPADRVGYHLAPAQDSHDMRDESPRETFTHLARELGRRQLAFLCTREGLGGERLTPAIREAFGGPVIANQGFTAETAQAELDAGRADAVAWGRLYIANPDLVARLHQRAPLNPPIPETFYGAPGVNPEVGYTDYPSL